ncbi:type II secretion system minor pseudopilin GspH [Idiomarina sp. OXR-189]|uniref:type II secretion system minor pseudopilin GspH n=1 Tax=Idiomarina sp. OXR-189 TaxID=3100175 RepID=UPI002AC9D317|nr:type II secretion system minor pseudopilin GspH [Idiomarina sp. OXR-189]WPZ01901.1 type II secretion system minor pseudopilin GspH [Idiomarina sp. OXR-189]
MATTTVTNRRQQQGFTLIELMLVMAILGLIVSSVMLTLPGSNRQQNSAQDSAITLQQQLQYAREYAMVRQQPLALAFNDNGYEFLVWQDESWQSFNTRGLKSQQTEWPLSWQLLNQDMAELAQNEELNDGVFGSGDDSEQDDDSEIKRPDVLILPSGEMTAFTLKIENANDIAAERWVKTENSWQLVVLNEAPEQ